jgi:hypothetical protein
VAIKNILISDLSNNNLNFNADDIIVFTVATSRSEVLFQLFEVEVYLFSTEITFNTANSIFQYTLQVFKLQLSAEYGYLMRFRDALRVFLKDIRPVGLDVVALAFLRLWLDETSRITTASQATKATGGGADTSDINIDNNNLNPSNNNTNSNNADNHTNANNNHTNDANFASVGNASNSKAADSHSVLEKYTHEVRYLLMKGDKLLYDGRVKALVGSENMHDNFSLRGGSDEGDPKLEITASEYETVNTKRRNGNCQIEIQTQTSTLASLTAL